MRIPSDEEIRALHERFAPTPEAFARVHTHCVIVARIAEGLPGFNALVRAGCLLHDLGVYRLSAGESYVRHGILGHELLRELGFPDVLCRFCDHHTGVGISAADIVSQGLDLPPGDYLAETEQEALVMYADKFHSKTTPPVFVSEKAYETSVARFGEGKVEQFRAYRERFGVPDLSALSAEYGHPIV